MIDPKSAIQDYKTEIARLEKRLQELRCSLEKAEKAQQRHRQVVDDSNHSHTDRAPKTISTSEDGVANVKAAQKWPLQTEEYQRYGRHLILDKVGLQGQLNLKKASVLIVGLGGLGSPAAAYLAGAGVGTIGLMDGDVVEISNLHRQIIHSTASIGQSKVNSAVRYLQQLNPLPKYERYPEIISSRNAVDLFEQYDLILDCTDHPATRYLISDAAVLTGKPLVSASSLGMEGQLLILNDIFQVKKRQPGKYCYRCVFPKPPPADTVLTCGEGGIFGPVVGVMGVLMATAALKILIRGNSTSSAVSESTFGVPPDQPSMLLYSAVSEPMFRSIRIKGRRDSCPSCSTRATITRESLFDGTLDYAAFCGSKEGIRTLDDHERMKPLEYTGLIERLTPQQRKNIVIFDVRPRTEYDLGHIEDSINWPIQDIAKSSENEEASLENASPSPHPLPQQGLDWDKIDTPLYGRCAFMICRRGNDSQSAATMLKRRMSDFNHIIEIRGGLEAWRRDVDPTFPDY
ncbi:MAG: hypothetical protein LQ337_003365 [Flavoplaca oasis]|nr:MAG: hypothetical protein LQ337_003365 [Flavoplaca oasis]